MAEPLRTLIIAGPDDAPTLARRLDDSRLGHETQQASTPTELLAALAQRRWDAVLLSAHAPELQTTAVLEVVRRTDPDVPVLVLGAAFGDLPLQPGVLLLDDSADVTTLDALLDRELAVAGTRRHDREATSRLHLRERVLAAATNGIAIGDAAQPGFPLVYVNPAFEQLTGYPAEELLGQSCRLLQTEETDPATLARIRDALRDGQPVRETLLNARRDGSTFWNDLTLSPVRGEEGDITHVIGVLSDVTERVRTTDRLAAAEIRYSRVIEDLAAAELRYRELVEQIPAVVYIADYDEDATLRYLSPQIHELLGVRPEAFLAENELWYRHVHPDDVERVREEERRTFFAEQSFDCEFRMVAADGTVHWVWERDSIVRSDDSRPLFTQGVIMDITAQRSAEDAVRAERDRAQRYLDLAGMIVLVLDAGGRVSLLNGEGHAMLGYEDGALIGRNWFEVGVPSEFRALRRAAFDESMLGGESTPEFEGEVLAADGRRLTVRFNNTLLHDDDGTIAGTLSSGVDVTERRKAEQQIAYLAYHDSLTGLPNRALLREHLELSIARARRSGQAIALLYLDLDDFKLVNDSLGHAAGDGPAVPRGPWSCARAPATPTCWPARAATSSCCCWPISTSRSWRPRRPRARCRPPSPSPSRSTAPSSTWVRRSASRCSPTTRPTPRSCWPTPTRRCTRPRPRGATRRASTATTPARGSTGSRSPRGCAGPSPATSSSCTGSRSSSSPPARSPRWRRSCAGATRSAGWSCPRSSCPSRKRPGSSSRSATGCRSASPSSGAPGTTWAWTRTWASTSARASCAAPTSPNASSRASAPTGRCRPTA